MTNEVLRGFMDAATEITLASQPIPTHPVYIGTSATDYIPYSVSTSEDGTITLVGQRGSADVVTDRRLATPAYIDDILTRPRD